MPFSNETSSFAAWRWYQPSTQYPTPPLHSSARSTVSVRLSYHWDTRTVPYAIGSSHPVRRNAWLRSVVEHSWTQRNISWWRSLRRNGSRLEQHHLQTFAFKHEALRAPLKPYGEARALALDRTQRLSDLWHLIAATSLTRPLLRATPTRRRYRRPREGGIRQTESCPLSPDHERNALE